MRGRFGTGTERVVLRRSHVRDSTRGACFSGRRENRRRCPSRPSRKRALGEQRGAATAGQNDHGGYGACPVAVFDEYQRWQRELERQPTDFFTRRLSTWFSEDGNGSGLIDDARASLAAFVSARADDLVFV